jgi:putative addiction module component (TIGR02574 family)
MVTLTLEVIERLSSDERLELISRIWDSLGDAALPLSIAQARELEGRLRTFERDRTSAVTWDDLKAELAARAP